MSVVTPKASAKADMLEPVGKATAPNITHVRFGGIATVATCGENLLVSARITWLPVTFRQRTIVSVQQIRVSF